VKRRKLGWLDESYQDQESACWYLTVDPIYDTVRTSAFSGAGPKSLWLEPMKIDNFFVELKRRNVYKVAVAYIVAGWALSQGIARFFPVRCSELGYSLIVVLIILVFPVAVVFAWVFEITPEGIKRTEVADAMPPTTGYKKHAWIYIVVIGGIVSIALFFLGGYMARNSQASSNELAAKSIAVLPFRESQPRS